MGVLLFALYSFITFLVLVAGALFWYLKNVSLSHEDFLEKGLVALQKKDYKQAKDFFVLSLAEKSDFKEAKFNLGVTYTKMKDYDNAKKCFEEILGVEPDDFDSLSHLGLVYFSLGDYENAKKSFEKILETDPRDFSTFFNLALTCQMQKDYEEAQEYYAKALQENEKDADCYFNLGIIAFEHKEYEKALEFFEKANGLAFARADIMFSVVRCKDELCSYETEAEGKEIVAQYEKLTKYQNLPLEFDVFWSRVYAKTGQIDKALEICNRSLISLPEDALGYRILGLIKLIKNELEDAKNALLKAIDLDELNPDGYKMLSYVFLQQENHINYMNFQNKYKNLISEKVLVVQNAEE